MNKSGVSLWRQIGETLAEEIDKGILAPDQRLPPAADLAERFAVNRHTVLKAISHLQSTGLVRIERGRGAHAVVNPLQFRLGSRQWFEQNLLENKLTPSRTVVSVQTVSASAEVASALKLSRTAKVVFVTLLGQADGFPANLSYTYFSASRLPGIEEVFRALGSGPLEAFSFSKILKKVGVKDFRRKQIRIRSRPASHSEMQRLKMAPSDQLLVTHVTQVDERDIPIVFAETCYPGSRTELIVDL